MSAEDDAVEILDSPKKSNPNSQKEATNNAEEPMCIDDDDPVEILDSPPPSVKGADTEPEAKSKGDKNGDSTSKTGDSKGEEVKDKFDKEAANKKIDALHKDSKVKVKSQTSMAELEALIDSRLSALGFATKCEEQLKVLSGNLRGAERKTFPIKKMFTECEDVFSKITTEQAEAEKADSAADVQIIESGGESDDDVQFVQTTYEPKKTPQKSPKPQTPTTPTQYVPIRPAGGQSQMVSILSSPPLNNAPQMRQVSRQSSEPKTTGLQTNIPKQMDLAIGMKLYGKKSNEIWYKGTLVDIQNKERPRPERHYRIKFDGKGMKVLTGYSIAYADVPNTILPVGSRVIAQYHDEETTGALSFYAGIVAESPSVRNNKRYLVFFDDGYAQYCPLKEIRKVYEQSKNVWDDIHPDSQEFIKSYLKQYPERPMVRLQVGQTIKTEWNGDWWSAKVEEVDASLVKMYFEADKRTEWIYRGTTRLEPLYTELMNAEQTKTSGKRRHNAANMKNKSQKPYVEYTLNLEEDPTPKPSQIVVQRQAGNTPVLGSKPTPPPVAPEKAKVRAVARKSTAPSKPMQKVNQFQASSISRNTQGRDMASVLQNRLSADTDEDMLGERVESSVRMVPAGVQRQRFKLHTCNKSCVRDDDPLKYKGNNPLLIPMLCGFERQIARQRNTGRRVVFYRTPCCRRLRTIQEADRYLILTNSKLTIDLFCFDPNLHTHSEFVPVKTFCDIKDLSYGKENVPISCVNGIDRQYPDYVEYSNKRTPAKGVQLNVDPEFLCGCTCTDGCRDPMKCECMQLTIKATASGPGGRLDTSVGYKYRRLKEQLITGIYECNEKCACDKRCHNRVAQNGLQLRLQVFKTEKRGWGLRCLDDIPCGGFICVYAGQLLTEQGANEDGQQYGDEYLAELDYIEVVERLKEGYESDVTDIEGEEEEDGDEDSEEDRFRDEDSDSDYGARNQPPTRARRRTAPRTVRVKESPMSSNQKASEWLKNIANQALQATPPGVAKQTRQIIVTSGPQQGMVYQQRGLMRPQQIVQQVIRGVGMVRGVRPMVRPQHLIRAVRPQQMVRAIAPRPVAPQRDPIVIDDSDDDDDVQIQQIDGTYDPMSDDGSCGSASEWLACRVSSSEEDEGASWGGDEGPTVYCDYAIDEEGFDLSPWQQLDGAGDDGEKKSGEEKEDGDAEGEKTEASESEKVEEMETESKKKEDDSKEQPIEVKSSSEDQGKETQESSSEDPNKDSKTEESETENTEQTNKDDETYDPENTEKTTGEETSETENTEKTKTGEETSETENTEKTEVKDSEAVTMETEESEAMETEETADNSDTMATEGEGSSTMATEESTMATDETTAKTAGDSSDTTADGIGALMITEPTSLNIDNQEDDEDDDDDDDEDKDGAVVTGVDEGQPSYKRTTRSQTSRFHNLPDPKSKVNVNLPKDKDKNKDTAADDEEEDEKTFKSAREFLEAEPEIYVMDAKSMGNIGRYLNHSCSPNVFVQNVFVDTHDLRFPWVSFMAGQYIRAGTELTWDYNYEVNSVPGKVLYCYCGAAECRGRLL